MIAAWMPFFSFLRAARQKSFDGDDATHAAAGGNGAQRDDDDDSKNDERDSEDAPHAERTGDGNSNNNNHDAAGAEKPNGRHRLAADDEEDSDSTKDQAKHEATAAAKQGGDDDSEPRPTMDEQAFKDELTEHLDSMYRLALSLSKNPRDAEDLTQEATLKALNHWRQYKPGTNMRAWLLAIVRNAFINRYRRQRNRPGSVEFDDVEPFLSDPAANNGEGRHLSVRDIDELTRLGELLDDEIKKALDELSDDFRETFLLAVVEELSYKDIAQILGVPVGTVMSRLFRARKQMQAKLSGYAHDAGWLQADQPAEGPAGEQAPSEAEESGVIES